MTDFFGALSLRAKRGWQFAAPYAATAIRRNLLITFGMISSAFSTSAWVLKRLKEKRRLARARSSLRPIAFNTCEAWTEPVVQALPLLQQM
jgi:hypothetical protein